MSLQSRLSTLISAIGADIKELHNGWVSTSVSLTFSSSANSPTFVATTGSDLTGVIPVGAKLKLTQTTVKYFIVTAIDATTITLYGGTDYTLANAVISAVSYSIMKSPLGFPIDPAKWTVEISATNQPSKTNPVSGTWYGDTGLTPTGPSISIPLGCWRIQYEAVGTATRSAASTNVELTLSTSASAESDSSMSSYGGIGGVTSNPAPLIVAHFYRERFLTLAAKTTYYLNVKVGSASVTSATIDGTVAPIIIRAICAYL